MQITQIEQMPMVRMFFSKTGRAKYTSHLDTMRTLTRAFRRGGLPIWHTQGYNPHMYMTFALPIALGYESLCESMDIRLTENVPLDGIADKINPALPPGFSVLRAATPVMKPSAIAFADYSVSLGYSRPIGEMLMYKIGEFRTMPVIRVEKKTKNDNVKPVDIKPISNIVSAEAHGVELKLKLRMAAGTELNVSPSLLLETFYSWTGAMPDSEKITRTAILDKNGADFA